jgi:hypothetical protein
MSKARDNRRAAIHAIQKAEQISIRLCAIAERHIIKGQITNYDNFYQPKKRRSIIVR